ncbi:hypothetical protein MRX96_013619 [Rhipicephalus microplus]
MHCQRRLRWVHSLLNFLQYSLPARSESRLAPIDRRLQVSTCPNTQAPPLAVVRVPVRAIPSHRRSASLPRHLRPFQNAATMLAVPNETPEGVRPAEAASPEDGSVASILGRAFIIVLPAVELTSLLPAGLIPPLFDTQRILL